MLGFSVIFGQKVLPFVVSLSTLLGTGKDGVVESLKSYAASEANYYEQKIYELDEENTGFEYKGVSYQYNEAIDYGNGELFGTEDYYPFFDAYLDARLEKSAQMGDLVLSRMYALNRYASYCGYDTYWDMAATEKFHYNESAQQILELIKDKMQWTISFEKHYGFLDPNKIMYEFIDESAFTYSIAELYGNIDSEFQSLLEKQINDGKVSFNETLDAGTQGECRSFSDGTVLVKFIPSTDASLIGTIPHEFGHCLNALYSINENEILNYGVCETHSIGGTFLLLDEISNELEGVLSREDAAYIKLCSFWSELSHFQQGIMEYEFMRDIYLHPEDYTGDIFAEKYLAVCDEMGFDAGWSPDYRLLTGVEWMDNMLWVSDPVYTPSYALAGINSIWLLYQQETYGTGREIYTNLVKSPITDVPYVEYCTSMGLPDFTDPASFDGLDDFMRQKLMGLYNVAYGQ
ncbi:MAG: hypothetical protein ACI4WS_00455 [Oscillospiraceae bacterium]